MFKSLKFHWYLLASLSLIVAIGTVLMLIASHTIKTEIALEKGFKTSVSTFRLLPGRFSADLHFDTIKGIKYPEHGEWNSLRRQGNRETLEFGNPGKAIIIAVGAAISGDSVTYEALPSNGGGNKFLVRQFIPVMKDSNPAIFGWYGSNLKFFSIPSGFSNIEIEITEVGTFPAHKNATLIVNTPLGFKVTQNGYGILWWFFFWRYYTILLAFYGLILGGLTYRQIRISKTRSPLL